MQEKPLYVSELVFITPHNLSISPYLIDEETELREDKYSPKPPQKLLETTIECISGRSMLFFSNLEITNLGYVIGFGRVTRA